MKIMLKTGQVYDAVISYDGTTAAYFISAEGSNVPNVVGSAEYTIVGEEPTYTFSTGTTTPLISISEMFGQEIKSIEFK